MKVLRRTDPAPAPSPEPAADRSAVLVSSLIGPGHPLSRDDTLPDRWADPSVVLDAATAEWADRLGLGAPGVSCTSVDHDYYDRSPHATDDVERIRSTTLHQATVRTTRATLCGRWILVASDHQHAHRDVLVDGEPRDLYDLVHVDRHAPLAWGPWQHTASDEPAVRVHPARIDCLSCGSDTWRITIGDQRLVVDEPFALAVLAAHR